mgnify:CR=1 FL=1
MTDSQSADAAQPITQIDFARAGVVTPQMAAVAAADTLEAKQAAATNASNAMSQKVYNTTLKMYNKLQAKTAARAWVSSLLH